MQCLLKKQAAGGHLGKKKKVLGVQSHFFRNKRHPKRQNYSARQYYSVFFNVAFFVQKKIDQSITSVPKLISSIEKMWGEILYIFVHIVKKARFLTIPYRGISYDKILALRNNV
jgi:hypothetical protein